MAKKNNIGFGHLDANYFSVVNEKKIAESNLVEINNFKFSAKLSA